MKKRLLVVITIISLTATAQAQIKKGSLLLGGDFGFTTQKTESINNSATIGKYNTFYLSPTVGVAVRNNLVVGGSLSYATQTDKRESINYSNEYHGYGAGVFVRKYKPLGTSGFYVFGQGGLYFNYITTEINESQLFSVVRKTKITGTALQVTPGISYAVSNRFHLETGFNQLLSLMYVQQKNTEESSGTVTGDKSSGISLYTSLNNVQSTFYLGFRLLLAK